MTAIGAGAGARLARLVTISFLTGFSGAMMPGTLLVAVIEQTAAQGLSAVWWLISGHALLELILVALLILGLRAVLQRPRVRGAIGIVGGVALVWMGGDMVHGASGVSLDGMAVAARAARPWYELLFLGAAICAPNPYFTGWWATIGMGQLAHAAPRTAAEYLAFYLGHEGADYTWYLAVGLVIVTGARWLTPAVHQRLILVCGGLIAAVGAWFFVQGVRQWRRAA